MYDTELADWVFECLYKAWPEWVNFEEMRKSSGSHVRPSEVSGRVRKCRLNGAQVDIAKSGSSTAITAGK
jgi:hypothetical protein